MEYNHLLIRYGELVLKGKNKKHFIQKLENNMRKALVDFPNTKIQAKRDHMYILLNGESAEGVSDVCKQVFGIHSFSLALKVDNEKEAIKESALAALEKETGHTFKVTTKRPNKSFPISSQEMNQILGGHLLSHTEGWVVNVHKPDVEIRVEIRKDATYITSSKTPGKGGMPVGTAGKSLLLMSGGIDSPVAGYLAMKRGVELEAIHFHSPPFTSERARQKVEDLAEKLTRFGGKITLHIIPFTEVQQKIHKEMPENYGMTIMRRMMLRISEMVAEQRDILSMITGESLGQVASQTMESMHTINEVTNYPVLRPLISMDKLDIIDISKEIDTYEISIRPYEDCCTIFVPKQPKTKPRREKVNAFESNVDFTEELQRAIEGMETVEFEGSRSSKADIYNDLF
ncbi:tRNA uracil 4-sulfurtransferase ThiI [Allobacillus sp. GCM10007491]|uniref:Probable tRNA sulfurtransferase n=1 Tax=Allobacillus saliphilus TaxID=2912308 RepID=A0A941CTY3_9BACI|nr:tRNA uracil 4-sulfurtransferase ThiI [Allobacillus saliphilus]MBR7553782.1 tRNA 4-thiouridine(8) synthase ThiI [Allobacillus saliphilus]